MPITRGTSGAGELEIARNTLCASHGAYGQTPRLNVAADLELDVFHGTDQKDQSNIRMA